MEQGLGRQVARSVCHGGAGAGEVVNARPSQHAGVVDGGWGEDRGINGARARGCWRQNHGAQGVDAYTTCLYSSRE
jgi:hypothetical protein